MSTGIAQNSESDLATMDMALVGRVKQGDLVRVMRERNWTQKELGVFLGLDQHQISRVVNMAWVPPITPEFEAKIFQLTGRLPEDVWPEWARSKDWLKKNKKVSLHKAVNRRMIADLPPSPNELFAESERARVVNEVIESRLTPREIAVVRSRFFDDETLQATGRKLGVSRERIRAIEAKALRKLRREKSLSELASVY